MTDPIIPVVAACIVHSGQLLLHKKTEGADEEGTPRNPEMVGLWEFPGGMMKNWETPELALHREIKEELGIDITIKRLVYARSALYDHHYLVLYYECSTPHYGVTPRHCSWVMPSEVQNMKCIPGTLEVTTRLSIDKQGVGMKGIRDPEACCAEFDPSAQEPGDFAQCDGDGHYLCKSCRWKTRVSGEEQTKRG